MGTLNLDEGDGRTTVSLRPAGGGEPVSAVLDVYESNNAFAALQLTHADPGDLGAAWADWLAGRGLPGLTHGQAFRVADHLAAEVEAFKKNDPASPKPDSVTATGSPASDSPAP